MSVFRWTSMKPRRWSLSSLLPSLPALLPSIPLSLLPCPHPPAYHCNNKEGEGYQCWVVSSSSSLLLSLLVLVAVVIVVHVLHFLHVLQLILYTVVVEGNYGDPLSFSSLSSLLSSLSVLTRVMSRDWPWILLLCSLFSPPPTPSTLCRRRRTTATLCRRFLLFLALFPTRVAPYCR